MELLWTDAGASQGQKQRVKVEGTAGEEELYTQIIHMLFTLYTPYIPITPTTSKTPI